MRGPCIVHGCNNDGIHQLPSEITLRAKWIEAAKLDTKKTLGRSVKKYTYLCSEHFKESDFYHTLPLFDGDTRNKKLKKGSIPSIFPWTLSEVEWSQTNKSDISELRTTSCTGDCEDDDDVRFNPSLAVKKYSETPPTHFVEEIPYVQVELNDPTDDPLGITYEDDLCSVGLVSNYSPGELGASTEVESNDLVSNNQYCTPSHCTEPDPKIYNDAGVQTVNVSPAFTVRSYKNNDKEIHFYSGLECYKRMIFVFTTLGTDVNNLKYLHSSPPASLDPLEQFFLTLMVLRRHKTFEELSVMYLISIKAVSNIVITWIRFMALHWRKTNLWISRDTVKSYMPLDFNDKFPMTRVIIDATECPIKRPRLPRAQQITFSTYKHKNTVKFLMGIAPSGLITYISPCYGGTASDRQIIERSEILNRFDPNDEIMVDKGLNVQDIFAPFCVKINMPVFFKKGNQIGGKTLKNTRKVASKRIHIERTIGLIKTYKILTEPMNNTEIILSSDIVFVCAMLTNFRSNIISKNA